MPPMVTLVVFAPLFSFLSLATSARLHFGSTTRVLPTLLTVTFGWVCTIILLALVFFGGQYYHVKLGTWSSFGLFEINWSFAVDVLTAAMLGVVNTVSNLVHLFSTSYMEEDPHLPRFLSYLSLFTLFMLLLVTADNLINLFLGWEGVGLCSYLLISFWFTRLQANKAAIKAMVVNRVSDLAFTVGILVIFFTFQSVEFNTFFPLVPYFLETQILFLGTTVSALDLAALLLFFGAMGKSAQVGLHTWLASAMEGPTPVSALIHAATMVTAGVFLLIRCSPLFEYAPHVLTIVTIVGAMTAFFSATAGVVQNDIKKVIAYSTCSQLGYMIFTCGLSAYHVSLFHLANHAFFKALLFLSAGAVIHAVCNEQDMRRLGGYLQVIPFTYVMITIGSLALMGFPFLTGYYSKDLILELAAGHPSQKGAFAYWLGLLTALFTAFYSLRLAYLVFLAPTNTFKTYSRAAHELAGLMAIPLGGLALGSLFFGHLGRDLFVGLGSTFWNGTVYFEPHFVGAQLSGEFLAVSTKLLPLFGSGVALVAVFFAYTVGATVPLTASYRNLYRFLSHTWYFDTIYNRLVNLPLLRFSYDMTFKRIDKGVLEVVGPFSLYKLARWAGRTVGQTPHGYVPLYAWISFMALLGWASFFF